MSELAEIRDKLNAIHRELCEFRAAQCQICRAAADVRAGHTKTLYGTDGTDGLTSRVQAIEETARAVAPLPARVQTVEERLHLVWAGVMGFLGLIGKLIWDYVTAPRQ